ncbi:protein fem-1 homolog B [Lingula anatina]|uniref:Protein fem-1 homolog B n=1 Tax=Lingula anatina TaxID=7574 RepID=A0A1S3JT44_LINAN|nr:protein fem-1 homolog B [Lingula anatina]|eukprot:XP_013413560.1 protein fem-1 homolog B [Lingula anatina]
MDTGGTLRERVYAAARDGMAISMFAILCSKNMDEIKDALEHVTEEDGQRVTPLIIAAKNGHDKVIKTILSHFQVDLEQAGTVKFDGYVIESATALWCAAGAGKFDVVQTLIEAGTDVNHPTLTNSTPLRAACFDGRLDIVKYLVEHQANIHVANKYNNTCLMIASYKGHKDVVTYLLEQKADPDCRAHCGATALHFAAEMGHLEIVKELLRFKAVQVKNDHGMTPLMVSAESCQNAVVEFLVSHEDCSKLERIEALELLGASYANDKDSYDLRKAYSYMWHAMTERHSDPENIIFKFVMPPIEAYENHKECQTMKQLQEIQYDHNELHMEALVLRERILGSDNPDIPHPVIFRGAVFADSARFDRCIALWMHAMRLRKKNNRTISKDLLRFAQVFSQMIHVGVNLDFPSVQVVLEYAISELKHNYDMFNTATEDEKAAVRDLIDCNIHTTLYLLVIVTKVSLTKEQDFQLCSLVYSFNQLDVSLKNGYRPLHMVADHGTLVDDFHVNDVVKFPNAGLLRLLLKCGSQVDAVDNQGNTALHVIVRYNRPISHFITLHSIITSLLEYGAHIDRVNGRGLTAEDYSTTGVAEIILKTQRSLSLKCLAAKAIKEKKIPYKGNVPATLLDFIDMH